MMYTRSVPGCLPSPSTGQCLAPRFQFTVRRPTRRKRTSPSRSTDPWTEFKVVIPCELTKIHFSTQELYKTLCNEFGLTKRPPIIPPGSSVRHVAQRAEHGHLLRAARARLDAPEPARAALPPVQRAPRRNSSKAQGQAFGR